MGAKSRGIDKEREKGFQKVKEEREEDRVEAKRFEGLKEKLRSEEKAKAKSQMEKRGRGRRKEKNRRS